MTIKIKKDLSWKEIKALNNLYTKGKTNAKIQNYEYIKYLVDDREIIERKLGNNSVLLATDAFNDFYKECLNDNFNHYNNFLLDQNLETDARKNYSEEDIKTLIFIAFNKVQLCNNLTTIRVFSAEFFKGKGSKYLENKKSVKDAVYKILGITHFPDADPKEHQWRFVVDCQNPRAVVLCENLNFLKLPWQAEKLEIKLWYVGGNNIKILDKIDNEEFKRPFFYSGDWDLAGLLIYSRIKKKFAANHKDIILLTPNNPDNRLPINSPHHNSKWNFNKEFSGLNIKDFNSQEIRLIRSLIDKDEWIEEESNDLAEMFYNTTKMFLKG